MFNPDFFPTPRGIIEKMTEGINLEGKTVLEPSAGKGDIVDFCAGSGANVIACEIDKNLQKILSSKCKIIAEDFLTVTSDQVSHIHAIIMNPPFSKGAEHILHAYSIAPKGCKIVALCNAATLENSYSTTRKELNSLIENYGVVVKLGDCFAQAERKTGVEVALITMNKPGQSYTSEFEGFFLGEEVEEETGAGLMSYNSVRDLVNRYVAAVKLYDQQLELAAQMNDLTHEYFFAGQPQVTMTVNRLTVPLKRNEFKKDMQKAGWKFVFAKMNMQKYATRGLKEDINKFVEQQTEVPFTMRNIYRMLDIVIQTTGQRMDKALIEVFDEITEKHADNRLNIKGWKTNSHYLIGKKFILPYMVSPAKEYGYTSSSYRYLGSRSETVKDLEKALCYVAGKNYDDLITVSASINDNIYGDWYESGFFKYKAFKNGNMHFEFKDEELQGKFNQHIARIKGYPLFEAKKQTAYQERQTGRAKQEKAAWVPKVLFTKKVA